MKVMAQIAMVMGPNKRIDYHTYSVTCKQTWTSREGTEYMWFSNVEAHPGVDYLCGWSDQDRWRSGRRRTKAGKPVPEQGGRFATLTKTFHNSTVPTQDDYYESWIYEYDKLLHTPANQKSVLSVPPVSQVTDEEMGIITWGPNWDDDLDGSMGTLDSDPVLKQMNLQVSKTIKGAYMFYLPRICKYCLNPACASARPSGVMYKCTEDGIALVDQDRCRGWRMCVSACPYKEVYSNYRTDKAEKCTLCHPHLEAGLPMVCSETCVGCLRYLGVLLCDADRVFKAAVTKNEGDLYEAQRPILFDLLGSEVVEAAKASGVPHSQIEATQQPLVYILIHTYALVLPFRPEFRTLLMVWYAPPLSPVVGQATVSSSDGEDHKILLFTIARMCIPFEYLADLFTADNMRPVELALYRLGVVCFYIHDIYNDEEGNERIVAAVGMTGTQLQETYRILAIVKYDDRYVVLTTSSELS